MNKLLNTLIASILILSIGCNKTVEKNLEPIYKNHVANSYDKNFYFKYKINEEPKAIVASEYQCTMSSWADSAFIGKLTFQGDSTSFIIALRKKSGLITPGDIDSFNKTKIIFDTTSYYQFAVIHEKSGLDSGIYVSAINPNYNSYMQVENVKQMKGVEINDKKYLRYEVVGFLREIHLMKYIGNAASAPSRKLDEVEFRMIWYLEYR